MIFNVRMKIDYKRFFVLVLSVFLCVTGFAKELEGENLACVHRALNAKLQENCFEGAEEKLAFLRAELQAIEGAEVSEEARLISESLLKIEIENVKSTEAARLQEEKSKSKKSKKISQEELNPDAKDIIFGCFEKYNAFKEGKENLSSYFYFHYNETMYSTLSYVSKKEQLKIVTGMLDDYKKLEEINPAFSETLNMYGAVLFFMPAAFGGNKKAGEEKILNAIKYSSCDYEKANSLVLYAQILFEKKEQEKSLEYMNKALEISPTNTTIKKIRDANKEGFSIFKMDEFEKKRIQ